MEADSELLKEAGYKIRDVYKDKGNLHVEVEEPTDNLQLRTFHFGKDLAEEKRYVKDGEIVTEPKWKIRLRNILRKEIEDEPEVSSEELETHKGERLDL